MLIDTHAHLCWQDYRQEEIDFLIKKAQEGGIGAIVVPGVNTATSMAAIKLARKYPKVIYPAVGIHPEEIGEVERQMEEIEQLVKENREVVVAIGEIGTDANNEEMIKMMPKQEYVFRRQAEIANKYNLPLIIHTRKTLNETMSLIESLAFGVRGVFHGFSHDEEGLNKVLERGFLVGIGGNVSYAKRIQRLAKMIPLEKMMLETDWPFVPSTLPNEPSSVAKIAEIVADLRCESAEVVAEMTTETARKMFCL